MFVRKSGVVCLVLLCVWLLAGCAGAAPTEPWTLAWADSVSSAQSQAPDLAYEDCARAQLPGGEVVFPTKNTWLATGIRPRVGLAITQLDADARFFSLGIITIDLGSNHWNLTESGSLARPALGQGTPAQQEAGKAWTLPTGTYASLALEVPDTQPGGSAQFWISDHNQEFVLARLYSTIQPPAGSIPITLAGQDGWEAQQGNFTIIGLVLTTGIYKGLGTLIFAGTTGAQASERLAAQAASDLNDILPA